MSKFHDMNGKKNVDEMKSADESITNSWVGEDRDSHVVDAKNNVDGLRNAIDTANAIFSELSKIAENYAKLRDTIIREFQNLKL